MIKKARIFIEGETIKCMISGPTLELITTAF